MLSIYVLLGIFCSWQFVTHPQIVTRSLSRHDRDLPTPLIGRCSHSRTRANMESFCTPRGCSLSSGLSCSRRLRRDSQSSRHPHPLRRLALSGNYEFSRFSPYDLTSSACSVLACCFSSLDFAWPRAFHSERSACITSTRAARAAGSHDATTAAVSSTSAERTTGKAPGIFTSRK
jgi:hypothetical protein